MTRLRSCMETLSPRYASFILTADDLLLLIQPYRFLLRGPLILHTFAAHYYAIHGAIRVPSLGDATLLENQAYGALAMSVAAVLILCP